MHRANNAFVSAENKAQLYLRKAADERAAAAAGAVLRVQAVVEKTRVAGADAVQAEVQLGSDAAPQVVAAAGELMEGQRVHSHEAKTRHVFDAEDSRC